MKRETLSLSKSILRIVVMGIFLSGAAVAQDGQGSAEGWMNSEYSDDVSKQQYYPYFGEDFFSSDPGDHSQQAIEAQRQKFEAPFLPYFGDRFLFNSRNYSQQAIEAQRQKFEAPFLPYFGESFFSRGETSPFTYLGEVLPFYSFQSAYPSIYQYQYPWMSRPVQPWPQFEKNWTRTTDYARSNSSFRIYSSDTWTGAA